MEKNTKKLLGVRRKGRELGFTLLEYCAGAAVMLIIVYVAMKGMSTNMSNLMGSVGTWAQHRSDAINAGEK